MIVCSVCKAENDEFAIVCSSCKSFLQARVDTLDLFGTIWQLMEAPRTAFRRIVLSQHKNYLFLLSGLLGMSLMFALIWYLKLGGAFTNLLTLVGTGLLFGPVVGILFVGFLGFTLAKTAGAMGRKVTAKNMSAVAAYSAVPIALSLAIVFPVELAVFGTDLFGNNPPPMVIKSAAYIALLGMDTLAVLWSLFLFVTGISVATGFTIRRALLVVLPVGCLVGLGLYALTFVKA